MNPEAVIPNPTSYMVQPLPPPRTEQHLNPRNPPLSTQTRPQNRKNRDQSPRNSASSPSPNTPPPPPDITTEVLGAPETTTTRMEHHTEKGVGPLKDTGTEGDGITAPGKKSPQREKKMSTPI